jgi:hypothetical protein
MNATKEIIENNLNKKINLNIAFNEEKIKKILSQNGVKKEIIDKINGNYITKKEKESVSLFEIKQKQKRTKNPNDSNDSEEKTNFDVGRKKKTDNTKRKHDKNVPDNIIKKCKRIFFKYIIIFINSIIKTYKTNHQENYEFKNLSYENYVNNLKKDKEIILLNMPLKDLVSLDVSNKYASNASFNKEKMEKILEEEKDNTIINSILNMTFGEWIDVFTFKNEINYYLEFNELQDVLIDLYNKEDKEYFSRFIFYLFNYKNWFQNKKPRKPKKRKN